MPALERCPVCDVTVKPENLARHLQSIHPRDATAREVRGRIESDVNYAPRSRTAPAIRVRKAYIAAILAVALLASGAVVLAPYFDPYRTLTADSCISPTQRTPYHIHVLFSIFIGATREPVPYNIGITPGCNKLIHTHDSDYNPSTQPAVLHVESPIARTFVLGDFFRVWGVVITETQVLGCRASPLTPVLMTVDDVGTTAFGALVLADGQDIVVFCGAAL